MTRIPLNRMHLEGLIGARCTIRIVEGTNDVKNIEFLDIEPGVYTETEPNGGDYKERARETPVIQLTGLRKNIVGLLTQYGIGYEYALRLTDEPKDIVTAMLIHGKLPQPIKRYAVEAGLVGSPRKSELMNTNDLFAEVIKRIESDNKNGYLKTDSKELQRIRTFLGQIAAILAD
ncbi:hypothetical protein Bpfe_031125 [Biomphalaria pfeifferi]|uniref:Uncharacterized protein n=1 Tax=Biomphalaria pfeifferi TaxID=112525 RepID=A0AAD8ANL4_BIOPF|nr:hypothetical protein Bpfe_031125 [Biomphalaria pfeifferi]